MYFGWVAYNLENSLRLTPQPFTYEVLIVGAGPAGMMAAEHAALAGLKVAVADVGTATRQTAAAIAPSVHTASCTPVPPH